MKAYPCNVSNGSIEPWKNAEWVDLDDLPPDHKKLKVNDLSGWDLFKHLYFVTWDRGRAWCYYLTTDKENTQI